MNDIPRVVASIFAVLVIAFIAINPTRFLVSEDKAIHALQNAGYSEVRITNRNNFWVDWCGCAKDDTVRFEGTAINPLGQRVNVAVCTGYWKDATVRGN